MPSYCLHCTKETQQKCACCPSSYYCGTECQKTDWHAVHKYELGAGASDATERNEPSLTEPKSPEREKKVVEMGRERDEYNDLISKTLQVLERQPRTKKEMRLTHQQRKQMQLSLGGVVPNPLTRRNQERGEFIQSLIGLVENVKEMPVSEDGGRLSFRKVVIDEVAENGIAQLFRKYDLLHLKVAYALATQSIQDASEVTRYREEVEGYGRRVVHHIMFGNQNDYDRVLELQHVALRDSMVEEMVEKLVGEAEEEVVNECILYIQGMGKEGGLGQPFGKPEGVADDTTRRQNTRNAIEEDQPSDREGVFSIQQYRNVVEAALGVAEAAQNQMEEEGKITQQQRDNTVSFLSSVWGSLSKRVEEVSQATRKKGNLFFERVWEEVSAKVGEVKEDIKQKLRNASISRIFCVASVVGFLLVTYGIYTYSFSPYQSIEATAKSINDAVSFNNEALDNIGAIKGEILKQQVNLVNINKTLTESSANTYNFLAIDPVNDDLDSIKNKLLVSTTTTNLINELTSVESISTNPITGNPSKWYGRDEFLRYLGLLKESKNLMERREILSDIQNTIKNNAKLSESTGITVATEKVMTIINQQKEFVDKMGISVGELSTTLDKQKVSLDEANVNLFNVRDRVRNTSTGAPFLMTMLRKIGLEYYLDPTLTHVMADIAAKHFSYELFNIQVQGGLYRLGQIESHMHKLLEAKGVFSTTATQFEWLWSIGTSIFTMDFAYVFFHALSCIMLVHNFLSPILRKTWESSVFSYVGDLAAKGLTWTGIPSILGYTPNEGDYERLKALRDTLLEEKGSVDATIQHALNLFNNQELTPTEYGVLIQLLYRKEEGDINGGNVALNRITAMGKNWFDMGFLPAYYLSRVIGYHYIYAQYTNFFWQLFYIVQYVWACLSWGHVSLLYGVVVIVLFITNQTSSYLGIGEKRETVLSHLISPFTTLFRLFHKNTYTSMLLVSLIYQVISYLDASNNVLGKVNDLLDSTGLNTTKGELWEREKVKREVERVLDQQTSPITLEDPTLDKGATIILQELALFANGTTEDVAELTQKITNLISIY
jgi:hypothetical protein